MTLNHLTPEAVEALFGIELPEWAKRAIERANREGWPATPRPVKRQPVRKWCQEKGLTQVE